MPSWKKVITSGSDAALNHITSSGNISGSATSTGSFGRTITKTMSVDDVFFDGGDNPLSANPKARFFYREGQYATIFADIYHAASLGGLTFEDNYNHSTSGFNFILQNGTSALRIKGNGDGDITIGGDISGSSTSTGSFGHLETNGVGAVNINLSDSQTNDISTALNIKHKSDGTQSGGIGVGIDFFGENSDVFYKYAQIAAKSENYGQKKAGILFSTGNNDTLTGRMRLLEAGHLLIGGDLVTRTAPLGDTSSGRTVLSLGDGSSGTGILELVGDRGAGSSDIGEIRVMNDRANTNSNPIARLRATNNGDVDSGNWIFSVADTSGTNIDVLHIDADSKISGSAISTGSFGVGHFAKNVGIGTDQSDSTDDVLLLSTGGAEELRFTLNNNAADILSYNRGGSFYDSLNFDASTYSFKNSGTNAVQIDSSGTLTVVRANAKVSGSATSTGSFGKLSVGGGNITTSGNMILDADGAQIRLQDGGTEFGRISRVSSDLVLKSMSNNNDILFKGVDGGGTITALQLDMSEGGNAIFNGNVQVGSGGFVFSAGALTLQSGAGTNLVLDAGAGADEITLSTSAFTTAVPIIATGDLDLYAGGGTKVVSLTTSAISLQKNTSISGNLAVDTNVLYVDSSADKVGINRIDPQFDLDVIGDIRATGDVIARRYVISSSVSHITSSFSSGSTIFGDTIADTHRFTGSLSVTGSGLRLGRSVLSNVYQGNLVIGSNAPAIFLDDGDVTNLRHSIVGGGNAGLEIAADIHNATTGYINFGVGGSTVARMIEGGNVGIGTTSPESILHIADGSSGAIGAKLIIDNNASDADGNGTEISFFNAAGASSAGVANSRIRSVASGNTNGYSQLQFWTYHASEAQRMVITSDGKVGIGTASPSKTFHAYANVSSDYAALVENDQATSGHGLQIHSDGNGSGTILFDVDAAGSSRFRVKGDGSVLVGFTTSQAEKLAVNGDFRATGNISGSSTSTGSFGRLNVGNGGSTVQPRFRVTDGVGSLPTMHPEQGDLAIFQNNASTSDISAVYTIAGTAGSSHYVFGDTDTKNVGRVSYDHSSDAMTLHTSTTEQVRIDSSGNVGIGHQNPAQTVHIGKSSASGLKGIRYENSSAQIRTGVAGGGSDIVSEAIAGDFIITNYTGGTKSILFGIGTSEKMRVDHSGNVGIGTTSPSHLLHVDAGSDNAGVLIQSTSNTGAAELDLRSGDQSWSLSHQTDGDLVIYDRTRAGETITFKSGSGNVGIGLTSPSEKLEVAGGIAFSGTATMTAGTDLGKATIDTDGTDRMRFHINGANNSVFGGYEFRQSKGDHSEERLVMHIDETGNVGIGISIADGKLHVSDGLAGSVTAHTSADELVIESSGNTGISILTPASSNGAIYFGDPQDNNIGMIDYDHALNKLSFTAAATATPVFSLTANTAEFGTDIAKISGSAVSSASFGRIDVAGKLFVGGSQIGAGGGGGSADNLGNHTATQDLDLNSNSIKNIIHITGSGNISGSTTTTASFGSLQLHGKTIHTTKASKVGLGTNDPLGNKLHIHVGDSGTDTVTTNSSLVIESNTNNYIQMLNPNGNNSGIIFGEHNDIDIASILHDGGDNSLRFNVAAAERIRINGSGNVGIGTTSPDGLLHAFSGNASQTANAAANQLIAENSTNAGVSILSGASHNGAIYFGDSGDAKIGTIIYDHGDEQLRIGVNNTNILTLTDSKISGSSTSTGSFGRVEAHGGLHIPTVGSQANGILFGDGDTGFYENADDDVFFKRGGNTVFRANTSSGLDFGVSNLFYNQTGGFWINSAPGSAAAPNYVFRGDTDTGMYRSADNVIGFSAGGALQLEIASNKISGSSTSTGSFGKVSIGTANPNYAHLNVDGDIALGTYTNSMNRRIGLQRSDGGGWTNTPHITFSTDSGADASIKFSVIDSGVAGYPNIVVIDKSGNLLLGSNDTTADARLHISGIGSIGIVMNNASSGNNNQIQFQDGGNPKWNVGIDGAQDFGFYSYESSAYLLQINGGTKLVKFAGDISGSATSTGSFGTVNVNTATTNTHFNLKGTHVAARGLMCLESTNHAAINLRSAAGSNVAGLELFNGTTQKWGVANRGDASDKFQIRRGSDDTVAISVDQSINTEFGGNVSGSSVSTGSFGAGFFGGNVGIGTITPGHRLHVVGDIRATGDIIANRLVVSSSVSHITSSFSSGSTIFGDTAGDFHRFTGSLSVSGSNLTFNKPVFGGNTLENFFRIKLQDFGGTTNDVGIGQGASGNMGFNVAANGYYDFYEGTNGLKMRFINGRLGIGTTNPARKLEIKDTSSNVGLRLVTGTALDAIIDFGDTDDGDIGRIQYDNNTDKMLFRTNASDRLTIDSSGNIHAVTGNVSGSATSTGSFGKLVSAAGLNLGGPTSDLFPHALTITDETPAIILNDTNVSNLQHRIFGGGNQGLEFSVDANNVGAGYFRVDLGGAERMRINEGGLMTINLGVSGSASSTGSFGRLSVGGGAPNNGTVDIVGPSGGLGELYIYDVDNGTATTDGFYFAKSSNNTFIINKESGGNFQLGTSNVSSNIVMKAGAVANLLTLDGSKISGSATSTGSFGALSVPGQATIGSVVEASSIMYKENVKQIESPLEKITKLRGVEFDYKKTNEHSIGMIAEEVNEIFPELVAKNEDGDVTAMSYTRMTAVLLEAVKELSAEVKELRELNNYSKSGDKKK